MAVRRLQFVALVFALLLLTAASGIAPAIALAQEQPAGLDDVVAVATNSCKTLSLRADGTVWGWGCNSDWDIGVTGPVEGDPFVPAPIQTPGLDHVRSIAAGVGHGLAARADGTVWAWGANDHGQVGVPPGEDCPYHPRPCVQAPVRVAGIDDVMAVAATENSSFALKADGTVWSWGEGAMGQLGTGSTEDTFTPAQVVGLAGVTHISAVGNRVVVLFGDGYVWGWGGGDEQPTPMPVDGLAGVVAVSAGLVRHVALLSDGTVWVWGEPDSLHPAPVAGLGPMVAVAGGGLLSGAVAADGTVWYWGQKPSMAEEPLTQADDLSDIVDISMHLGDSLALKADGTLWIWSDFGKPEPVPAPMMNS